MRYISLFSGVEAASVAWRDLDGFEPVAFCEIDKFPSAVLAYRFPDVPNLGDITKVDWKEVIAEHGAIDLIVGGSPCQSFSIAGGRASLDGESRLMFEYIRAVDEIRPTWFLWENVPGVLSTRDNAFGQLLTEMEKLGYGMAWRTLDAQFFGVAQRRRRVFLVGCLGDGGASAAVLFEPESVCGNTQSSKQKREELTRAVEECSAIGCESVMPFDTTQITSAENKARPEFGKPCHMLNAKAHVPTVCLQGSLIGRSENAGPQGNGVNEEIAFTLNTTDKHAVCLQTNDDMASSLTARYDSSPCADRGQNIICVSDDQAKAAIDVDMSGSLKVGGGCAVNSAGTDYVNALCARDYKGIGNQDIGDGKLICQKVTS